MEIKYISIIKDENLKQNIINALSSDDNVTTSNLKVGNRNSGQYNSMLVSNIVDRIDDVMDVLKEERLGSVSYRNIIIDIERAETEVVKVKKVLVEWEEDEIEDED